MSVADSGSSRGGFPLEALVKDHAERRHGLNQRWLEKPRAFVRLLSTGKVGTPIRR